MKKRIVFTALLLAGAATVAVPEAAQASTVVCLTSNAYQYATYSTSRGGVGYQFTLHAGRGFRTVDYRIDHYDRIWLAGHGAEHPSTEGWILASHVGNC